MSVGRATRRTFLEFALTAVAMPVAVSWVTAPARAQDDDDILSRDAVLRDPDIPALTAPDGDLTIVEYFDYQCPYCRKVYSDLMEVVRADGKVRLVVKDWPILGNDSVYAAQLSLAARYQGKFREAHEALIGASRRLTRQITEDRLAVAGINVNRAKADLKSRGREIDSLLARNDQQARGLRFQSVPSFIVGTFRLPGLLDSAGFRQIIADARALAEKDK